MRFVNVLFATMLLMALAGAAVAKSIEPRGLALSSPRIETISLSKTWLWQPSMRRVAAAH